MVPRIVRVDRLDSLNIVFDIARSYDDAVYCRARGAIVSVRPFRFLQSNAFYLDRKVA